MTEDTPLPDSEPTRTFAPPPEGTPFGHYRLGRRLGAGGMGEVYSAVDVNLGRRVALKFLPPSLTADPEMKARLFREARSAAVLSHPNIVTIYEVGETDGRPYLAMELVEGKTLHSVIADGETPITRAIEITGHIADGLAEAHSKRVIHRDIKPSNILIDLKGRVKILDFGLAKLESAEPLTQTGSTLGTLGYMSPEQVESGQVDTRADIFSLGVVMYQLFTGRSPFVRDNPPATLYAIVNDIPPKASTLRPQIPPAIDRIIEKAMAKLPARRYQSVEELADDLRSIQNASTMSGRIEQEQSIAVLPFADMSPAKDQEYFCDGLAEELINALSRLAGLKVVSRTSAFQFKGLNSDIRTIGDKLGVSTVLEGSVRKSGDRLRITAQLIAVADGMHLWSDKFDRTSDDLFAIQDEISATIVETMKMKLIPSEVAGLKQRRTQNLQAYDMYLQGRYFWNQRTHESIKRGLACFEKAIALDPEFALAYVGLADSLFIAYAFDFLSPGEAIPRAREIISTSLKLDPLSAEAHTSLASIQSYHDWNWTEAKKSYQKAIECNAQYATAHHWYAEILMITGDSSSARREFALALGLDPLSPIVNTMYGIFLYKSGELAEAASVLTKAIDLGSKIDTTYANLGYVFLDMGKRAEGTECFDKMLDMTDHNAFSVAMTALAASKIGDQERARILNAEILEKLKSEYIPPTLVSLAEWSVGNIESARLWIDKAFAVHDLELVFLTIPAFDEIRRDAHIASVVRKMGLNP